MKKCQGCGKETNLITALGPVLLCTNECYPDAVADRSEAQDNQKSFDITVWTRRRYNRLHDNTVGERVNRRNGKLNSMAHELGFDGFSQMLTAWKNGEIKITIERSES